MSETCENCRFWLQTVKLTDLDNVGPVTARYMDTILDKIRASE